MIDVYYPFFLREAIWEELRYSVRSVCKHLKESFRLVIVGDRPSWLDDHHRCLFLSHHRSEGMPENTTFDAITKLLLYLNGNRSEEFIRIYDDVCLLSDITRKDIDTPRALFSMSEMPNRGGIWWEQLRRTLEVVAEKRRREMSNFPVWNHETHFPECFNADIMLRVIDDFHALKNRLLTSSLYWNTFFPSQNPVMFKKDWAIQFYNNQDAKYYTSSEGDLKKKCSGKHFLNYNNTGLNENLKRFLMQRFPEKCMYEL